MQHRGGGEAIDDILPPEPKAELVHWMPARPLTLGVKGISLATLAAFALGAFTAVAVLGMLRWPGPRDEAIRRERRRVRGAP